MPYNYANAFLPSKTICKECMQALAVAAVMNFQSFTNDKVKGVVVDPVKETVIVQGTHEVAVFSWQELGFIGCSDQGSGQDPPSN